MATVQALVLRLVVEIQHFELALQLQLNRSIKIPRPESPRSLTVLDCQAAALDSERVLLRFAW